MASHTYILYSTQSLVAFNRSRGMWGGQWTRQWWVSTVSGSSLPAGLREPWSSTLELPTVIPLGPRKPSGNQQRRYYLSASSFSRWGNWDIQQLKGLLKFSWLLGVEAVARSLAADLAGRGVWMWAIHINLHSFCLIYKICKNLLFIYGECILWNAFMFWPLPRWTELKFIDSRGVQKFFWINFVLVESFVWLPLNSIRKPWSNKFY